MTTPSAPRVRPSLPTALAESLVVVVVWGSSFVLVKAGLRYAGPLTLAGLRYTAAFLILLPFALRRNTRPRSRGVWVRLALIGLCAYHRQRLPVLGAAVSAVHHEFVPDEPGAAAGAGDEHPLAP